MKSLILAFSMILATAVFVTAQQQEYGNPYRVQPQPQLEYNAFENEWSYERPGSTLEYNAFENEWEYAEPGSELLYNPFENRWEIE